MKDFEKVKTIIRWQITRDPISNTMKIDQSIFIQDLVINKNLSECDANVISIKADSAIDMIGANVYKEEDFHIYQQLIEKLMYLACGIRPDIMFAVSQLSKYNINLQKSHPWAAKKVE